MTTIKGRMGRARSGRLSRFGVLVAVVAVVALGAAPASAANIEHFQTSGSWDEVRWDCGYPMRVVGEGSENVVIRTDKKLDGNLFFTVNYAWAETWTTEDGRWFGLAGNGLTKDVKAKQVDGSVYAFTFHESGQPIVVTDPSGTVIYRDRGIISFDFTIDIATDTFEPGELKIAAPHPLFDLDLCKAVAPITGNDSADHLTPRPLGSTDSPMGYYEYLPPSYPDAGTGSPLLVVFNGYGENGDGSAEALGNLLWAGIPRFIDVGGWPTDRPLVVLAAQHIEEPPGFDFSSCDGVPLGGSCNMFVQHENDHASPAFCTTPDEVHDFIDYAVAAYDVDPSRVYVTGLSCGAFGAWEYLAKYGDEQVAAAVPIAGEGRPAWATAGCGLGSVAIWSFHGELDDVVDPQGSIAPMNDLAGCPGVTAERAKLTVYPDLTHDGWDQAYSGSLGDDIYTWMLGFSNP